MAYNYLIELYHFIEKRHAEAEEKCVSLEGAELSYQKGRISFLKEFESFLENGYNHMLPRKIHKALKEQGPSSMI